MNLKCLGRAEAASRGIEKHVDIRVYNEWDVCVGGVEAAPRGTQ